MVTLLELTERQFNLLWVSTSHVREIKHKRPRY